MKWRARAKRSLDAVLDALVGTVFLGMTVLIIVLVILRYAFNSSLPGGPEALRFAFIYTTFLGAALLVGRRDHIAIHLATRRLPLPLRRSAAAIVNALIIALHIYLLILSFRWIAVTGGNTAEELKIPLRYIQVALPIGCGLTSLYALNNIVDALFDSTWGDKGGSS